MSMLEQWGLSNVPLPMLKQMLELCEQNGWQKPSCYQGAYNLVTRGMEEELLPTLRLHGITFNAFQYSPPSFLSFHTLSLPLTHLRTLPILNCLSDLSADRNTIADL
jgi:diketogulonate reductase-like aldo/keto reductase